MHLNSNDSKYVENKRRVGARKQKKGNGCGNMHVQSGAKSASARLGTTDGMATEAVTIDQR